MIPSARLVSVLLPVVFATASHVTLAATLANGSLTVNIRDDNGAIGAVSFGGADYFNAGTPVSNWGLQNGTATSSFVLNSTSGSTGQPVSVSANSGLVVVGGTYTGGGADVAFVRSYSLVAGHNVLKIETTFQNNGGNVALRYFDTFDPDQGNDLGMGFGTYNDVFTLGGDKVGQARIQGAHTHTVIAGSSDSRAVIAAGNPFQIDSGIILNGFFDSPFDGGDNLADNGLHIGFESMLASGGSDSFTYYLALGLSPEAAQIDYLAAELSAVPEPASALALGCLLSSGLLLRRRKL